MPMAHKAPRRVAPLQKIPATSGTNKLEAAKANAEPTNTTILPGCKLVIQAAISAALSNAIFDMVTLRCAVASGSSTR